MTIIIQRNYQSFWVVLNFQGKRFPKTHIPYPIGSIEIEYLPTFTYSKCTSPTEHMGYGPIESIYHFRRISPSKARKTLRVPTLKVSWSGPCRNEAAASPFARFDFWAHRLVKSLQLCHHEYIFQGGAPLFNTFLRLYSNTTPRRIFSQQEPLGRLIRLIEPIRLPSPYLEDRVP